MNPLVSAAWLASRIDDPHLIVLDATLPPVGITPPVDTHARYLAGHIPGALFFDIEAFSDHATPLPHMLPPPAEFSRLCGAVGIASDATLIVYEQEGVFSAPRAWWMFRTMGVSQVFVLDGGLHAWLHAGFDVEPGPVQRPPATFHASFNPAAITSLAQLQHKLAARAQVLDARSAGRFAGTAPEPRPVLSSGHMPGSTSLPFPELVTNGRLKSPAELAELFAARGIHLDQPVTTTCGSGVTAAVLALGLELAGATHVSLYDGSWAEYAQQPGLIIETT